MDKFDASAKYQCKAQHTKRGNRKGKKLTFRKRGKRKRVQFSHMLRSSIIIQLLENIHLACVQNLSLEAQQEL